LDGDTLDKKLFNSPILFQFRSITPISSGISHQLFFFDTSMPIQCDIYHSIECDPNPRSTLSLFTCAWRQYPLQV